MRPLIVCRALMQNMPDRRAPYFMDLARRCAQRLMAARCEERPVVHYFTRWPTDSTLLPGCSARASEPLFTGPFGALTASAPLRRYLKVSNVRQAELIGLIDLRILGATLAQAPPAGFKFRSDPDAICIMESEQPRSQRAWQ